jgi:hypothetical protein
MARPAVAIRRISVLGHDDVNGHRSRSWHHIFEIVHLNEVPGGGTSAVRASGTGTAGGRERTNTRNAHAAASTAARAHATFSRALVLAVPAGTTTRIFPVEKAAGPHLIDRRDESVATLRHRFDEARILGRIIECFATPVDRLVEP